GQVSDMPEIRIFPTDTRKVRSGALGAPQHRTVIFGFHRQRIGSIAFHLVTKGPDHLAVTGIAAFAHVDVPAGKLQWRIEPHVGNVLHGLIDREEWRDLDDASDAGGRDDGEYEAHGRAL